MTIDDIIDRMWRAATLAKEGAPDIEVELELERAENDLRALLSAETPPHPQDT
jgi:hypothetical protein